MKIASILYRSVLLESGSMAVNAGPRGASAFKHGDAEGRTYAWQTPQARAQAQRAPFVIAVGPSASAGPMRALIDSPTSISWQPTFQPFLEELSAKCDWVLYGHPDKPDPAFLRLRDLWRSEHSRDAALEELVPENFVRTRLIQHVTDDLMLGVWAGWDISVDNYHGRVISTKFAPDSSFMATGFALPVLVPRVADLPWEDVARIRRLKAISRLREVLHEVELEALEVGRSGGDVERALHNAYTRKVAAASEGVRGVRSLAATGAVELLVGTGTGYAVAGLSLLAPLVGGGITALAMTGWHVRHVLHTRRERAWIGVMDAIAKG